MAITRKENDTGPPIESTLTTDGVADDLTGADVVFTLWKESDGTLKVEEATATVVDASAGEVRYDLQSGDLDETGLFLFEWEVTFSDGTIQTYPNRREGARLHVIPEGA